MVLIMPGLLDCMLDLKQVLSITIISKKLKRQEIKSKIAEHILNYKKVPGPMIP